MAKKLRSKRAWLEGQKYSGSWYSLEISTDKMDGGYLSLSLSDCNRSITWYFGKPGDKRAVAKITKIKKLVDEIYEYLVPASQ